MKLHRLKIKLLLHYLIILQTEQIVLCLLYYMAVDSLQLVHNDKDKD